MFKVPITSLPHPQQSKPADDSIDFIASAKGVVWPARKPAKRRPARAGLVVVAVLAALVVVGALVIT